MAEHTALVDWCVAVGVGLVCGLVSAAAVVVAAARWGWI